MISPIDDKAPLSSFFTPDNILICREKTDLPTLINQLLTNLAVNYGIGNISTLQQRYLQYHPDFQPYRINQSISLIHFRSQNTQTIHLSMAWMAADTNQTLPAGSLLMVIVTPHSRADLFLRCIDGLRVAGDALFSSNPPINITAISSFDIWQKIHASNLYLTPFVTAAEIMQPVTSSICDNENLEKAIDELTLNNTSWLPVVDKEQELVGEISLYELIQVCFPRHILWMDDINPLLQFETFKNVLFNESFTWLTEIINYHVATIQHDEPAVLAIIQMTKLETHHAYVLNNKTLTGIITLPHIAKVILRQ